MFGLSFYGEIVTVCAGLFGLGAVLLLQCGGKRSAPKKKYGKSLSSSSKKKSTRTQRSLKADYAAKPKQPGRSSKPSESSRSKKSSRRSEKTARSNKSSRRSEKMASGAGGKPMPLSEQVRSKRDDQRTSLKALWSAEAQKKRSAPFELSHEHIELNMEPRELRFEKRGGLLKVQLHNPTDTRQAIKVKCSDNNLYRVNPVYGFIESGAQLNVYVMRQNGSAKLDKIVFVIARAPTANTDLKELFKASANNQNQRMMVLPLMV